MLKHFKEPIQELKTHYKRLIYLSQDRFAPQVFLQFLGSFTELIGITLFIPLLGLVLDPSGSSSQGRVFQWLSQFLAYFNVSPNPKIILGGIVCVLLIKASIEYIRHYWITKLYYEFHDKLRQRFLNALGHLDYRYFTNQDQAFLTHLISSDLHKASGAYDRFGTIIASIPRVFLLVIASLFLNWRFSVFALTFGLILGFFLRKLSFRTYELSQKGSKIGTQFLSLLLQAIRHFRYLTTTGGFLKLEEELKKSSGTIAEIKTHQAKVTALSLSIIDPLILSATGILFVVENNYFGTPLSKLIIAAFILQRTIATISQLERAWNSFSMMAPGLTLMHDTLTNFEKHKRPTLDHNVAQFNQDIVVQNVSFAYQSREVLKNLNFKINKNSFFAIVGESGAGKSTLIDLLSGLLPPTQGQILVDGKELKTLDPSSWHSFLGYVTQECVAFNGSVLENITFGEPLDEIKLKQAAAWAGVESFVHQLEKGYLTEVGDFGIKLSGGQKQRIGIARELYRNTQILLLDEPTSALDAETEKMLMKTLDVLKGKVTIIMITHRLFLTQKADHIVLLEQGQIKEQGNFKTLYEEPKSRFRELCLLQEITI